MLWPLVTFVVVHRIPFGRASPQQRRAPALLLRAPAAVLLVCRRVRPALPTWIGGRVLVGASDA
jgi:hypothetical protein